MNINYHQLARSLLSLFRVEWHGHVISIDLHLLRLSRKCLQNRIHFGDCVQFDDRKRVVACVNVGIWG